MKGRILRTLGYAALAVVATATAGYAWQGYDAVSLVSLLSALGLC